MGYKILPEKELHRSSQVSKLALWEPCNTWVLGPSDLGQELFQPPHSLMWLYLYIGGSFLRVPHNKSPTIWGPHQDFGFWETATSARTSNLAAKPFSLQAALFFSTCLKEDSQVPTTLAPKKSYFKEGPTRVCRFFSKAPPKDNPVCQRARNPTLHKAGLSMADASGQPAPGAIGLI